MRETATSTTFRLPVSGGLADDVVDNARDHPDAVVLSRRLGEAWQDVTAAAFADEVIATARGLVEAGLAPGERVVLLARTRWEWTVLDYAIWCAGGVSVPVYPTAPPEQADWILRDSGAGLAVVETLDQLQRLERSAGDGQALRRVLCLDQGALDELTRTGRAVPETVVDERRTATRPGDLATVVYTSGTTGRPRGCRLTHANLLTELGVGLPALDRVFAAGASTLLVLPLAHVLTRVVQVAAVRARVRLGHAPDVVRLARDLAEFSPTFVLGVPRILERLYNTASQQATADGHRARFERATDVAIAYSRAQAEGRPGPWLRARHRRYDKPVYAPLRATLGGRCRVAISGGAPLGERLGHFFRGAGVDVLEGYGLTETSATVSVNLPGAARVGTVGRPLGGTTVRVADDGELLVRGGQVFDGYWADPVATAAVLDDDGWLHTGDLGEVDDEGFVRVTGRKQELLVTLGGKNVAPTVLEDAVRAHPLVSQCMVVGDGRPFVAALVTLDADATAAWARTRGLDPTSVLPPCAPSPALSPAAARAVEHPLLRAEVQAAVDAANQEVSQAESIRRFCLLRGDWTEAGGQLTPSLKLRRGAIAAELAEEIEALYAR